MPVTPLLTAAYDKGMEAILLVFILMNADDRTKDSLKRFLAFYRENRALIAALAGKDAVQTAEETDAQGGDGGRRAAASEAEEKNRPREEVGDAAILSEFLNRLSV